MVAAGSVHGKLLDTTERLLGLRRFQRACSGNTFAFVRVVIAPAQSVPKHVNIRCEISDVCIMSMMDDQRDEH